MARNENREDRQRGWINYFRVLAGCYLLYLAYRLMRGIWGGSADSLLLNGVGGAVFAAAGAAILWREWRAYQYAKRHRDDPETWTLDEEAPSGEVDAAAEEPEEDAAGEGKEADR